jgi:hypothetical protein
LTSRPRLCICDPCRLSKYDDAHLGNLCETVTG